MLPDLSVHECNYIHLCVQLASMATGGSNNAAKLTMSEPRNGRPSAASRQVERGSQDGASVEDRLNNWVSVCLLDR